TYHRFDDDTESSNSSCLSAYPRSEFLS
ncbi:D-lactate dehydrogenase, partial [Haemophilus influenzae]